MNGGKNVLTNNYGTGSNARTLRNKNDLSLDLPVLIDTNDYRNKLGNNT